MLDASTMADARARAEELMTDTCVIERATGRNTQDPVTGSKVPGYATILTSICKLQMPTAIARPQEVGGRTAFMIRLELHLPASTSVTIHAEDRVTVSAVGPLSDPNLVGRTFRVVGPPAKSLATALRFEVQEYAA